MKLKTHHSGFPSLGSHLLKGGWSCRLGEENAHKVAHPFILKRSATDLVLIDFHDQIPDFSNGFGSLFLQKDFQKPHKWFDENAFVFYSVWKYQYDYDWCSHVWEIARQLSWRLVAVVPLKLYTANPLISFCGQKCREDGVTYVKGTQNNQHRHAERPKYWLYLYIIMTEIHKHWALADPVTSFCGQNVGLVM